MTSQSTPRWAADRLTRCEARQQLFLPCADIRYLGGLALLGQGSAAESAERRHIPPAQGDSSPRASAPHGALLLQRLYARATNGLAPAWIGADGQPKAPAAEPTSKLGG
ncbi:hypothetical protein G7Z17_g11309 [Cylindrodendrum hubeiense]|uniref:Uncharacterized protein n=1 Tax=Cylindrodendrum hubeiense TaxID=595255 RepID=A0A9P5H5D0_9HYPO|nr:hypothetical protein G7Z17_g11309 [Cylindrodendrum hubeiense]